MENGYLNYTHGTMLQHLCAEILDAPKPDLKAYIKWILAEQEAMRKKQPVMWKIPVSMQQYYGYLGELETILRQGGESGAIRTLLEEIRSKTRSKIHAIFLTQETFCWPSLESVFRAARESLDFEATVIYTPYFHENYTSQTDYYDSYREMGVPVLHHNAYDLPADSPDVVFMIKPYGNVPEPYIFENIEKVVPRMVYIPYGMEISVDLIRFGFQFYGHCKAWRHCAYGQIVKDYGAKYGYRNGDNIAVWGHPKADHYRTPGENKKNIPTEWKARIGSRKVILWTPHHLNDLEEQGTGTWLVWGEHILRAALAHPDVFFIVRPHPLMMGALVNSGALTQEQADNIRRQIDTAENIIWDTNEDYRIAFDTADAIISDGTTFCVEFLYTNGPILLTPRNMEGFYLYQEMLDSYYIVNSIRDISDFMDMIKNGEDPLKEKRQAMFKKNFFVPEECTVGEHIIRQVKKELHEECCSITFVEPVETEKEGNLMIDQSDLQFPLVSILVLCYKNQELLYGMLDTILRQDYPRIQLIVSDDGSADFDVEQIRKYIDLGNRGNIVDVMVRSNEQNMRTVRHIHHAMQYVNGEYLVFTAADDRFCGTSAISMYVEQFLKNPEKQWIVARCRVTSPDYKRTLHFLPATVDEPFFAADDAARLFSRWSRRGMAIPCCMAFRTKAIESVGGFDLDYLFLEDWPLVLKLLRSGNAPIYCNEVTALHSAGGITNSNARYGKEIRRLFYEDKYTIFRKEVDPYLNRLTEEDKKAYKQYLREIMERHYFFYIDWPDTTPAEKLKLMIQKPIRGWWAFEQKFTATEIPRKKLAVLAMAAILISMLFFGYSSEALVAVVFHALGWVCLCAGLLVMAVCVVSYPLHKLFERKAKLRHDLVN